MKIKVHWLHMINESDSCPNVMRESRGGGGAGGLDFPTPPLENHKNIGFLNNTAPGPLKITKLPNQNSMLGNHWPGSKMPFKWRFAGGSMMVP